MENNCRNEENSQALNGGDEEDSWWEITGDLRRLVGRNGAEGEAWWER